MFGADLTGIHQNESIGFISAEEKSELFGTKEVMKIPTAGQLQSMMNLEEPEDYSQMMGEFKIEKGFAG